MAEKITLKIGFTRARDVFAEMGDTEMVAFFDKRIEQASKKSSGVRKLTPHQLENEKIKDGILENMSAGVVYNIADMLCTFDCFPADMTPNRLAALLSQLGPKGTQQIERIEQKGKVYFTLPEAEDL